MRARDGRRQSDRPLVLALRLVDATEDREHPGQVRLACGIGRPPFGGEPQVGKRALESSRAGKREAEAMSQRRVGGRLAFGVRQHLETLAPAAESDERAAKLNVEHRALGGVARTVPLGAAERLDGFREVGRLRGGDAP